MGGPIAPGVAGGAPGNDGALSAAAAITCLWSGGRGGAALSRERMLEELPGRLGVRIGSLEFLLGDAGGDICLSTTAEAI